MTSEIQQSVCRHIAEMGHESICENFGYNWEMDVASLSKSGLLHEYEVKISHSDFLADKKRKQIKFAHYEVANERTCPHYFYYVCPENLISKTEIPIWAGLYYFSDGNITLIKSPKRLHTAKIDTEKVLRKMLRLNIQRKYLGGSMHTYLTKKVADRNKLLYNSALSSEKETTNK